MISTSKVDPRAKLVIVIILSTLAITYNDIQHLLVILIISIIISFFMQSSLISILARMRKLVGVMLAIAAVQSLFIRTGNPLINIWGIILLTDYGLIKSLEFFLRLGIIIVSAAIITTSTSREIIQGLVQWHCPYEIAFMVSTAIRFLPVFKEEMFDMVIAIQLRGIDFKKVKLNQKLKIYKYILVPIVINSILKAKELSVAMEMRGFRAYPSRTSYRMLKMQVIDYIIIGLCIVTILFLIIL